MDIGGLSIYNVEPGDLCEGDLRAVTQQWHHLVDYIGIEDPEARLIFFDDQTQNAALQDACRNLVEVGGCTPWPWLGAYGTPFSGPHELVHVLVGQVTNRAYPNRFLVEGIAHYLTSEASIRKEDWEPFSIKDGLVEVEGNRNDAHHFVAWFIDREGIEEFLRIYEELGPLPDDDFDGFARAFGFETLIELQAEFEATSALEYPAPWKLELAPTPEEWAQGVDMSPGCGQPQTHRLGTKEWVRVIVDVPEAGRYRMVREEVPNLNVDLQFQTLAPRYEEHPQYFWPFESWGDYACFEQAGLYQFNVDYPIGTEAPALLAFEREDGPGCE